MAYLNTYSVFARFNGDKPDMQWTGLRKGQALWRYNWINRNQLTNPELTRLREFGWQRDVQA